nr:hypothetical protein [uncultured Tyzzerella sp.]
MKSNVLTWIIGILLLVLFIFGMINSASYNVNMRTGGAGTGKSTVKIHNNNNSNNNIKNAKVGNKNNGENGNNITKTQQKNINYFLIAIICLLSATIITIFLIIYLIVFFILKYKNKNKIIQT